MYKRAIILLFLIITGCNSSQKTSCDLERSGELWARYNALGKKEQHTFIRNLTADDLFAFTLAAIPAHAQEQFKEKQVDFTDPRAEEVLAMLGDVFEKWGEKRLAEGRRLTAFSIIGFLKDPALPPSWRAAFRGYLRIIFFANPGSPPSDAYEIGLTNQDINKLKTYLKKTSKGDPQQMR